MMSDLGKLAGNEFNTVLAYAELDRVFGGDAPAGYVYCGDGLYSQGTALHHWDQLYKARSTLYRTS